MNINKEISSNVISRCPTFTFEDECRRKSKNSKILKTYEHATHNLTKSYANSDKESYPWMETYEMLRQVAAPLGLLEAQKLFQAQGPTEDHQEAQLERP